MSNLELIWTGKKNKYYTKKVKLIENENYSFF